MPLAQALRGAAMIVLPLAIVTMQHLGFFSIASAGVSELAVCRMCVC